MVALSEGPVTYVEPSTGFLIFVIGIFVGTISGYTVDFIHGSSFLLQRDNQIEKSEKLDKNLLRYLTIRVKKIDLETNYFEKDSEEKIKNTREAKE